MMRHKEDHKNGNKQMRTLFKQGYNCGSLVVVNNYLRIMTRAGFHFIKLTLTS